MKQLFATAVIGCLLVGCGVGQYEYVQQPEFVKYDYQVDGLLVAGVAFDYNKVGMVVELVENKFPNLDLTQLLDDHNIELLDGIPKRGARASYDLRCRIVVPGDADDRYYLLAHELLHVVAKYWLGVDDENNRTHNVDGLFAVDEFYMDSVEWFLFIRTVDL
jgi:hypothetical protein